MPRTYLRDWDCPRRTDGSGVLGALEPACRQSIKVLMGTKR